ncbi:MAG: prolyl oligopeptidase family serine peptidase [Acidobacteria bacterium]|nr:prolyl oligopeptidase family serine peptidase [Acidobacteriota bacterium]
MIRRAGLASLLLLLVPAMLAVPAPSAAQESMGKVPLTHDVYDSWKSISGQTLSDDGNWLLYAEVPQDGDAELVVQSLTSDTEFRTGLGKLTTETSSFARPQAEFTAGEPTHVVFLASPDKATLAQAKKDKLTGDKAPKKTLGIMALSDGSVTTVERVKSFALPDDTGTHVAYLLEKALPKEEDEEGEDGEEEAEMAEPEAPEEPAAEEPAAEETEEDEAQEDEKKKDKTYGTELRVRTLADGSESSADSVMAYEVSDDSEWVLYTVSSEDAPESDGVYSLDTGTGAAAAMMTGEGNYKHLTLDEDNVQFAFVTDTTDYAADEPVFELYGGNLGGDAAALWVSHTSTDGFPAEMAVTDKEGLTFSDNGAVVMFGIRAIPEPEEDEGDEDAEEDEPKAEFDLWHWNDPYPQPQQLLTANNVNNEAFESVWWIDEGEFVQLANEDLVDVSLSASGTLAMGTTDKRWAKNHSYEGFFNDVHVVDTRTGIHTVIAERVSWGATLSPTGSHVAWFGGNGEWIGYDVNGGGGWSDGQDWFLYDVAATSTTNLTADLDVEFESHSWDTPNLPASYFAAGFTEDGSDFLFYDRYDIWAAPTNGDAPRLMTDGHGRDSGISLRWQRIDPERDGVPVDRPILLSATNDETMATGYWVDRVTGDVAPRELHSAEAMLVFNDWGERSHRVLFNRRTFSDFPDLWVADLALGREDESAAALSNVTKVTDLGAQTDPYIWGNSELRDFRSADGLPLKGILIKPDNYDPDKQYPLMVYIYETLHTQFHFFRNPGPGSSINPSYYSSNGYVIWMPDIEYVTPGYPGRDAMKAVLPGIQMLVNEGVADPEAIGIQGHSWGGYQISYMITQTDIFAAAEAGAPVSNMTSAYGGIRWGSGLVRQFQYERTQSRLGGSLWEVPLRYIENSPVFWADDINTPLLYMHNDEDGAVPWYQGIELIMALRRLGREAYMFNYNGEAHGLRRRVNQEDWTIRMADFFDHHLKGEPAPSWMTEGIRGWDKGEEE